MVDGSVGEGRERKEQQHFQRLLLRKRKPVKGAFACQYIYKTQTFAATRINLTCRKIHTPGC